jgi:hypothetical protein
LLTKVFGGKVVGLADGDTIFVMKAGRSVPCGSQEPTRAERGPGFTIQE